jgi:stearoyl-CoA desaturase (delta-9 desaturase)
MHLSVFAAFLLPFKWEWVGLCVASYYLRMFAITAGYHRYFSHRTYKMSRIVQFAMAWLGGTAVQKGALWWAANHRLHHRNSDQPNDIHSPKQHGFWWSHVGWILSDVHDETEWSQIQDLAKFPELKWLNHYHLVPGITYAVLLFVAGGWGALVWGFCISTVLLWHGTFTINSLSHVFGSIRYKTADTSRNNFWLSLVTLGEGWHNNHHCYMSSTKQGFFWWEIDGSYYTLKVLSYFRIVSDLRKPPLKLLESKRLRGSRQSRTLNQRKGNDVRQLERA